LPWERAIRGLTRAVARRDSRDRFKKGRYRVERERLLRAALVGGGVLLLALLLTPLLPAKEADPRFVAPLAQLEEQLRKEPDWKSLTTAYTALEEDWRSLRPALSLNNGTDNLNTMDRALARLGAALAARDSTETRLQLADVRALWEE